MRSIALVAFLALFAGCASDAYKIQPPRRVIEVASVEDVGVVASGSELVAIFSVRGSDGGLRPFECALDGKGELREGWTDPLRERVRALEIDGASNVLDFESTAWKRRDGATLEQGHGLEHADAESAVFVQLIREGSRPEKLVFHLPGLGGRTVGDNGLTLDPRDAREVPLPRIFGEAAPEWEHVSAFSGVHSLATGIIEGIGKGALITAAVVLSPIWVPAVIFIFAAGHGGC